MQIKITVKYYFPPILNGYYQNRNQYVGKDTEKLNPLCTASGNANGAVIWKRELPYNPTTPLLDIDVKKN